jgi:hypothetical protein
MHYCTVIIFYHCKLCVNVILKIFCYLLTFYIMLFSPLQSRPWHISSPRLCERLQKGMIYLFFFNCLIGQAPWAFDRMDMCAIKVFNQSINQSCLCKRSYSTEMQTRLVLVPTMFQKPTKGNWGMESREIW